MAKLSKDLNAGNLHPREDIFLTGTLASLNAEVDMACDGASTVSLDLRGTYNLTIEVAGTVDGTNWIPIPMRPLNVASVAYVALIAGSTTQGVWVGKCAQYRRVRARVSAFTSGSCTAFLLASTALLDDSLVGRLTPLIVTATGAAGAAVTLTLPAAGAGLRHYLTYISITRFAAATLTAAATPVLVTTTNMPGAPVFSMGADALVQGATERYREDFSSPLATSAQNTATTIVCPVTANVIWRATVGYYLAP